MSKTTRDTPKLIVAASETDPDMLYATKFWAPDPFIFLQRDGKRTLVLSDLEIDRGRKQADADEFVMFSEVERELQQARMLAVQTNQPMRMQFNCPSPGQYRVVELIGTSSVPAAGDGAADRCALTSYPFPADQDKNPRRGRQAQ